MLAQFFGPDDRPLFGIRHEAVGSVRDTAVLICPSWGLETLRSHRGIRQFCNLLAGTGYEVLRFDYSGTGDSQGDGLESRLEHWLADIATAAAELRESSGCRQLCLFGHRLGALLAAESLRRRLLTADALIAFDAPADGKAFIKATSRTQRQLDAHKNRYRSQRIGKASDDELLGFDWPTALARDLAVLPAVSHTKLLWAQTENHDATAPAEATFFDAGESPRWTELASQFSAWSPTPMLQTLVRTISTWQP